MANVEDTEYVPREDGHLPCIYLSPRHERLDEFWKQYRSMLWGIAIKLSRMTGHPAEELLPTLYLHMNRTLHSYDEDKAAFSTFYYRFAYAAVFDYWLRYESERRNVAHWARNADAEARRDIHVVYGTHEAKNIHYKIPERMDDWALDIIDCFPSNQACWNFLVRELRDRDKFVLEGRFKYGLSLEVLGRQLMISKQRVRQLEVAALSSLRKQIFKVEQFTKIFGGSGKCPATR